MKKPKKSSAGNKPRQKENGQARQKTGQKNIRKKHADRLSREHEAKPHEPASPHSAAGRKLQRDEDARKRKLWERKQAELEARRLAAQSRQTEEDAAHKRTMQIAYSITGAALVVLLCVLAWHSV
jgi:hypothetical protein